jgi:hypothetical protein
MQVLKLVSQNHDLCCYLLPFVGPGQSHLKLSGEDIVEGVVTPASFDATCGRAFLLQDGGRHMSQDDKVLCVDQVCFAHPCLRPQYRKSPQRLYHTFSILRRREVIHSYSILWNSPRDWDHRKMMDGLDDFFKKT